MICVVMKPEKAPVVDHENLYGAWFNGSLVLRVRARNARHAEEKFMYLMEREAKGKTLDFNLEQQQEKDNGKNAENASGHGPAQEQAGPVQPGQR